MNRTLIITGMMLASGIAMGQAASKPAPSSQSQQVADQATNSAQKDGQKTAAPAPPAGGTKVAPEPKTKEEEAAMKAVIAKANDPAAMYAATDDFAMKYPDSNVRGMLYRQVMLLYEQQGNADKSYEAARKSLSFDPDDPLTLVHCSSYLSSHTRDSDLDKDDRLAEAVKMANDALANIDQLRLNAQAPPEEKAKVKEYVRGQAYEALAMAAQAKKDWATAEVNYQKSVAASPDSATMLRLGFAQRMQNKLDAALATFNQALAEANKTNQPVVAQIATQQKESVEKQLAKQKAPAAGTTAPAAGTAAPATAPPATSTTPSTPKQ